MAAVTGIAEVIVKQVVVLETAKLVARLGVPTAPAGEPAGLVVVAMGKFGGREMNYASDLDVVFLYDHDGVTVSPPRGMRSRAEATSNAHFFAELAQRTMRVFNAFGPHGRLFEMDSRLRPSGRSGPAAVSLADFARYFASDGAAAVWERQALLKARLVVGGSAAVAAVRQITEAATYGRPWTASDVESIRHMRLRMEEGAKSSNLKRGPGGVVDIEFIAQLLQLVHGGRESRLRTTGTMPALVALRDCGLLDHKRFVLLERSYRVLRGIEGRLRLLEAPARHDLPESEAELQTLARLLGYGDAAALVTDVRQITTRVRGEFDAVFAETTRFLSQTASRAGG